MATPNELYSRSIARVWTAPKQFISDNHQNSLILDPERMEEHDPFLFLAEDWFQRGAFGKHPHRGIETVTYVMDGKLEHYDSKTGEIETLYPGDAQWMTAGSGVIHLEDPAVGETVHSLQLWVNLPSDRKMTAPRYQNLRSKDMVVREEEGARIRVFSGSSFDVQATTNNIVPITMVELSLESGACITQDLPAGYEGFIFVIEGEGQFGRERTEGRARNGLWLESAAEPSLVEVRATTKLKAILYAGQPIQEPIVARGPFVMNTEEQVREAYRDYLNGKFI